MKLDILAIGVHPDDVELVIIVSFGPHFFVSTGGAMGRGPTRVSVCENALPVAKTVATIKTKKILQ